MATAAPPPRRSPLVRALIVGLLVLVALVALYVAVIANWSYSSGERAGWVQKFSKKGWLCKTWEGEIALVSMPGAIPEKFLFTVLDDAVAEDINRHMGRRVALHYEQKVGLPTSCFGETRHYVTRVVPVPESPQAPLGSPVVPSPPGTPGVQGAPSAPPASGVPPAPSGVPPSGTPGGATAPAPVPNGAAPPAGPVPGLPSIPAPAGPGAPAAPASR